MLAVDSAEARRAAKREEKERKRALKLVRDEERQSSCYVETYMVFECASIVLSVVAAIAWSPLALLNASPSIAGLVGAHRVQGKNKQSSPENWKYFSKCGLVSCACSMLCLGLFAWQCGPVIFPKTKSEKDPTGLTRSFASICLVGFLAIVGIGLVLRMFVRNAAWNYVWTVADNSEVTEEVRQAELGNARRQRGVVELAPVANPGAAYRPQQGAAPASFPGPAIGGQPTPTSFPGPGAPTPPASWGHVNAPQQ
jgi:hypothetical protein